MTSLSFIKRRVIWILVIVLGFLAASLPQTYQAQILGPVVDEREPNDTPAKAQPLRDFPVVVRGNSAGKLAPTFEVLSVDIPPIVKFDRNGNFVDVVGTPRQTTVIRFRNRFVDRFDWFRFLLNSDTNIAINLTEGGGFHDFSADAQIVFFGTILTPPIGPIVTPTDLDLLLFNARTGDFVDGSFDGSGFILLPGGGLGFSSFPSETLPNPIPAFQGNPGFVPTVLKKGVYLILVNDANKFSVFGGTGFDPNNPTQPQIQIPTNYVAEAWDSSSDNPYVLRLGARGGSVSVPEDDIAAFPQAKGAAQVVDHYAPVNKIQGMADDYYVVDILKPGNYTFNVSMGASQQRRSGRLLLLRLDEASHKWTFVGQSAIVNSRFERLPNLKLGSGRYTIAMMRDGIKPMANKFNFAISVIDETPQVVAMEVDTVVPSIKDVRAAAEALMDSINTGGNNRKK